MIYFKLRRSSPLIECFNSFPPSWGQPAACICPMQAVVVYSVMTTPVNGRNWLDER